MESPSITPVLLKDSANAVSIGHLHLKPRTYNALIRERIGTVADLLKAVDAGILKIRSIGATAKADIHESLAALLASTNNENVVNWETYCSLKGIEILPKDFNTGSSTAHVLDLFPKLVESILCYEGDEKPWRIIQRSFGLYNTSTLTVEELSVALELTPSTVRYLKRCALIELREVFIEDVSTGKPYRINNDIRATFASFFKALSLRVNDFILETELLEVARTSFNISLNDITPPLYLLLTLAGMKRLAFSDLNVTPVWEITETGQRDVLLNVITRIDSLLTKERAVPLDELDVLLSVNRGLTSATKISNIQLRRFLDLCSSIERREDGLMWGKFEYLKSHGNQVERALLVRGAPMRVEEIAREIDRHFVPLGKRKINRRTLLNYVCSDSRFAHIGRSGLWGLSSWSHIDTNSILELMEKFLITLNKPATVDEIYNYVKERRPVSYDSVELYLSTKDKFKKVDLNRWGLSNWSEVEGVKLWTHEDVAEFVVKIFKDNQVKELKRKVLIEALMSAAKVSRERASGMLSQISVIETVRKTKWGPRYAVLRTDYRSRIKKRKPYAQRRKTPTIFERIDEAVRNILESRPGKQIELQELHTQLVKEYGFLEATVYNYISRLDYLEKVEIPGSKTKLCRLAGYQDFGLQKGIPYSCFISYSSKNKDFAEQLYADLETRGVQCWFAPEHLKIGEQIRGGIDKSIRTHDRMLLVLSETSLRSQWVQQEVETALEIEREQGRTVLFPIRLDDTVLEANTGWPSLIKNTRQIGDFCGWQDPDIYQRALERLLRDLKEELFEHVPA